MREERGIRTNTILLTAGLLLIVYFLGDVFLLVFAGVLLAVGLDGIARAIGGRLSIMRGRALVGVIIAITVFIVGALSLAATRLLQQFWEVRERVVKFAERAIEWLTELGALPMMEEMNGENGESSGAVSDVAGHAMSLGVTAVGVASSLLILIVLTLFLSANPALYRDGLVRLVPPDRRDIVQETLSALAHALRWWFLGQLVSMTLLGVTVGLGLFLLGVDLWLTLAVLTALLTVVPFIGPLIATVPIVAVGFTEGTQTGIIVLAGYLVIQNIEGNIVGPLIQEKAVNLAPALLVAVQVLLSLIFGFMGLILAAPLTIVAMVSVQKLWVEHTLGEKVT
ncbi:AI-2E family transporter [Roseovarius sp. D0-M9]|uniref:AI-2E family transporter n=1 Tax=Roseovarius sp. D0-M9 TaxID=3127117 RepID=UPI00300F832B